MNKKICEVLLSSSGEPKAIAYSKGVSKKKRRKAWKRALKEYRVGRIISTQLNRFWA